MKLMILREGNASEFVRQSCLTGSNGMKLAILREGNASVAAATQLGFTDEVASLLWEDFGMS